MKLSLLIFTGLLIRLSLITFQPFKIDMDAWVAWAYRLAEVNPWQFYSPTFWTNYTPGFLYFLWLFGLIQNTVQLNQLTLVNLIKLPAIIADLTIAIIIYRSVVAHKPNLATFLAGLIIFNPFVLINSSIWGQIDSLLTLSMLISIRYLSQKKLIFASISYAIALLIKPQAIAITPIFGLYCLLNFRLSNKNNWRMIFNLVIPGLLTLTILAWPFFPTNPIGGLINLIKTMSEDYSYNSLFAYNFWGIFGFWKDDHQLFLNLSWHVWSILLFICYWILISYFYFQKQIGLFALSTLACLAFYFLPTRVHDRYLYPALILLIFTIIETKSYQLVWSFIGLSVIHALNLYFVYVYYNEFYYSLPHQLYLPLIYNTLQSNGFFFSLLSTIIFAIISLQLLFISHHEKTHSTPQKS